MYGYNFYPFEAAEDGAFDPRPVYVVAVKIAIWSRDDQMTPSGIRLLDLIRRSIAPGEEVYHEPLDKSSDKRLDQHRFYFSSLDDRNRFVSEWEQPYRSTLFDRMEHLSGDRALAGMLDYEVPHNMDAKAAALYFWTVDNLKSPIYTIGNNSFVFTAAEDLMIFRLKLLDDDALNLETEYFNPDGTVKYIT